MKHKRKLKKIYQRERNFERAFSFSNPCSICVSAKLSEKEFAVAKTLLITMQHQSHLPAEILLLCDGKKTEKLAKSAAKKNPTIKVFSNHNEFCKAEKSTNCDLILYLSVPIPEDTLYRLETSKVMHPDNDAFQSTINYLGKEYVIRAFTTRSLQDSSGSNSTNQNFVAFGTKTYDGAITLNSEKNAKNTRICAGMVLFNPDIEHSVENAKNILPQVEHLFIVDNGSSNIADFAAKFADEKRVTFILNDENKGIAFALNRILDAAYENGYDWVLTLDQDTICDRNMISIYKRYIHLPEIGIISPHIIHRGNKTLEEYKNEYLFETEFIFDFDRCITSASLTNVKAAKEVGGFNDELFIDAVDFDLNIRLISAGYSILKANDTYIVQEIGNRVPVNLFKLIYKLTRIKKFKTVRYFSVHSDFRLYYIARNYKWFLKKYKTTSPTVNRWASFKDMLLRFMLYPKGRSRRAMLKAVRKGYRDSKKMTY